MLFSECKLSINQVKITLELTELNQGLQRLSLETEALSEFSRVKLRFDKLTEE